MRWGLLTESQYKVLVCRGKGMTQRETAVELGTSRANVSMIEARARRRVEMADQTLEAYKSTITDHAVIVPKGTRFYEIPSVILGEGDRCGVHLKSNIVDIVRMVNGVEPSALSGGKTNRSICFVFNKAGKLRLEKRPGAPG